MAHTLHQRMRATVDLLTGMRLIPVREALAPKGFSEETLKRGWRLLEQVGLTLAAGNAPIVGERADAMEAFQKDWFPIVHAIFHRRHPELVVRLLGRLRIKGRRDATYRVPPFLIELRRLESSEGAEDREAFAHLQARGLTEEVILAAEENARAYLKVDQSISYGALPTLEERAVAELWDFYLEWAAICRQAIKNRNWLRSLGLMAERPSQRPLHDVSVSVFETVPDLRLGAPNKNEKKLLEAATPAGTGRGRS